MKMTCYQVWVTLGRCICFSAAIVLCAVCVIEYQMDEDLTEVSFKRFLEDDESIYPEITICISDAYLGDRLRTIGNGINETTYEKFLKGELWDKRMLGIDYNNVTVHIEEFIKETCIRKQIVGKCKPFKAAITPFVNQVRKCATIHNPEQKSIMSLEVKLNLSLFPNSIIR